MTARAGAEEEMRMGTEEAARITHADLDRLDLFRRAYDDAIARRANASNPWREYQWAVTEAAPALIACCRISAGIPLPVLAWIAANPEAAKGLASGEMVAVSVVPRPLDEWHEDMGPVLWWRFPIEEAPFVGTPLGSDWTWDYYTHFTPCPEPPAPSGKAQGETS